MAEKQAEAQGKNLHQRICAVMASMDPVPKDGKINFGSTKYNFTEASAVFSLLQKKLADAGVLVIPAIQNVMATPNEAPEGRTKTLSVQMRFRVVNADNPTDYFEAPWFAQAPTTDDKAINKAGTSGEKYFLMKLFLLSDGEDPDADSRSLSEHEQAQAKPRPAKTTDDPFISRAAQAPKEVHRPQDTPANGDRARTIRAIENMLQADPDARAKLPKPIAEHTDEELAQTYSWLGRRMRGGATKAAQEVR